MIEFLLLTSLLCYWGWKKAEKIKNENLKSNKECLYWLPVVQFIICLIYFVFILVLSSSEDFNAEEYNNYFWDSEVLGGITTFLSGINYSDAEANYREHANNASSIGILIFICSIIFTAIQIIAPMKRMYKPIIYEVVGVLHSVIIYYIGHMYSELFEALMRQMPIYVLFSEGSNVNLGLVVLLFIPLHFIYHFALLKLYSDKTNFNS